MHVVSTLLRNCAAVSKLSYLFRIVPPRLTFTASAVFDLHMEEYVREMIGGVIYHYSYIKIGLPIASNNPSFGIGLYVATSTAASAFISPCSLVQPIISSDMASPGRHPKCDEIICAHDFWKTQVVPSDEPWT